MQPVVRLDDGVVVGYEALARVTGDPGRGPDWWLQRAAVAGRRRELEVEFLRAATRLGTPPDDAMLFVNLSPDVLDCEEATKLLGDLPARLVVEITEDAQVGDYDRLKKDLEPWVAEGSRIAIDDAGAGYSSLRHVIELVPDFLKLDRTLICEIDRDQHKAALVRALAAFAREVGTSVIAEGIETPGELSVLVEAGIALGQGYLLSRPAEPWPTTDPEVSFRGAPVGLGPDAGLRAELQRARTATDACEAIVRDLFRLGQVMPSLYLEQNGSLRCVAQRGLWQVLDGLAAGAGVTGQVWATGEVIEVDDVTAHPGYLEAVPGIVSEVCVPVFLDGRVVGALNIDSCLPLRPRMRRILLERAQLLSRRLAALGWKADDSPWQRAVSGSVVLSEAGADGDTPGRILTALMDTSRIDSGVMIRFSGGRPVVHSAVGPLGPGLAAMGTASLESVCRIVEHLSSCYTGHESTGIPYIGSESIREAGARAAVILPLRAGNTSLGAVVLAHSRPMRLSSQVVEPLELLAGQAAATLNAADLVAQLRAQARQDGLTGLLNRSALEETLTRPTAHRRAVIVADVDHFKSVNDRHGHPSADLALQALAQTMIESLPGAEVFRMGGDEFVCVVAVSDEEGARRAGECIRASGREVLELWSTTLSVGVAVGEGSEDLVQALVRADAALMAVKRGGRGRLALAS